MRIYAKFARSNGASETITRSPKLPDPVDLVLRPLQNRGEQDAPLTEQAIAELRKQRAAQQTQDALSAELARHRSSDFEIVADLDRLVEAVLAGLETRLRSAVVGGESLTFSAEGE